MTNNPKDRTQKQSAKSQEPKSYDEILKIVRQNLGDKKISEETINKIEVKEITKDSTNVTLIVVPGVIIKELKRKVQAVIEGVEGSLGGTVFVIRRRVASGLVKGEKRNRTGPTLKDYQELIAKDLVVPSYIVDRRTLVREDGSKLEKIIVDRKNKEELENRFEPMRIVFEDLFGKKACFQANYY